MSATPEVVIFAGVMNLGDSLFAILCAFYLTTWEEYHTGRLYLGLVRGPVEGVLTPCAMYAITAFKGESFWQSPCSRRWDYRALTSCRLCWCRLCWGICRSLNGIWFMEESSWCLTSCWGSFSPFYRYHTHKLTGSPSIPPPPCHPPIPSGSQVTHPDSHPHPPPTASTAQGSFFKTLDEPLSLLEADVPLWLQHIEEQSRILRDAFVMVEKR